MPACNLRAAVAAHLRAEFGWLLSFECFWWLLTTLANDKCSVWGNLQPWWCCKQTRSVAVSREKCSSLGFWVPWSMQQGAGAKLCRQFQLLPGKAERIWWCSKIQNSGRMFKEAVLEWRSPCAEVPSMGSAIHTTVVSAGRHLFSWGENSWMLIIRALVLQLHMRFIQYAPLRIYLDPSWLWFPIYTSLRSESDTLSCVLHTDD